MNKKEQFKKSRIVQRKRNRMIYLGIAVLVALSVVGILISENNRNDETIITPSNQEWPAADGKALGSSDAPVLIQEFADFQCPYCEQFYKQITPQIITDYVSTGIARMEYHHFIVIDSNVGGYESRHAAQASECALNQGDFWDYYSILYSNQAEEGSGAFSDDRLIAFADALGYDKGNFSSCINSSQAEQAVKSDEALAASYGLHSTPALVINGNVVTNPLDYETVKAAINDSLQQN